MPHFFLLDVHSVRFGPPLSWAESRDNLVLLNRWFQLRATRTDRARFWQAYRETQGTVELGAEPSRQVEAATVASNLRFWAARTGRYLGNNRQFRKVKRGAIRGHAVKDLPNAVLAALLADPDAVFATPGAVLLKDSPSATVAVVPSLSCQPLPGGRGSQESDGNRDSPLLLSPAPEVVARRPLPSRGGAPRS